MEEEEEEEEEEKVGTRIRLGLKPNRRIKYIELFYQFLPCSVQKHNVARAYLAIPVLPSLCWMTKKSFKL